MRGFILSLDPAQIRDWSALSVIEAIWTDGNRSFTYQLRNVQRKQNVPYPEIVQWVIKAFNAPALRKNTDLGPVLCLDSTGIGVAIKDLFRKEGLNPIAITITSGNGHSYTGLEHTVGKARLVGKFLACFDSGRFQIPLTKLPTFIQLHKELKSFRAEISAKGNVSFEAPPNEHDDLVVSCALGCWFCEDVLKPQNYTIPPVCAYGLEDMWGFGHPPYKTLEERMRL
jgi:hypothetical protein